MLINKKSRIDIQNLTPQNKRFFILGKNKFYLEEYRRILLFHNKQIYEISNELYKYLSNSLFSIIYSVLSELIEEEKG